MKLTLKIFLSLTILYAFMIFYLSSMSDLKIPKKWFMPLRPFIDLIHYLYYNNYLSLFAPLYPLIKQQDKVLHILLYSGFGILLFLTLKGTNKTVIKAVIFALFLGVLYGASDEFHQMFVSGRSANIMDLVADAAGLLFSQAIVLIVYAIVAIISYMYIRKRKG